MLDTHAANALNGTTPLPPSLIVLPTVEPERTLAFTLGESAKTYKWGRTTLTLDEFDYIMFDRKIRPNKDGLCFVCATLLGGNRNLKSVDEVHLLTFDIDGSMNFEDVDALIEKSALMAWLYTTHSHKTTRTEVVVDDYEKWMKGTKHPQTPTLESLTLYLRENRKGFIADKNPSYDMLRGFERVADKGNCYILQHEPLDKLRVVIVLDKPINVGKLAANNQQAIDIYKSIYHGVAAQLGFVGYDVSCADPCRLFYLPSCPKEREKDAHTKAWDRALLDWEKVPRVELETTKTTTGTKHSDAFNLFRNLPVRQPGYDIESMISEHLADQILGARDKGGHYVTCPFEAEHSDTGGMGTFAANANGDFPWTIHCSHNSCQSAGRKKYDFLKAWIDGKALSLVHVGEGDREKEDILAMVAALTEGAPSTAWEPIIEALVQYSLAPIPFDDDVLGGIVEKTGKKIKTKLDKLLKTKRRDLRKLLHGADDETKGRFIDYSAEPFNVYAAKARKHLIETNADEPRLFVRGTGFVRVDTDTTTKARTIIACGKDEIRAEFNRVTIWGGHSPAGEIVYRSCPVDVAEDFFATEAASFALPYLRDVTDTPFFDRDGNRVDTEGYHAASGILLAPTPGLVIPPVSEKPSARDVVRARKLLLVDLYGDFPFSDGGDDDGAFSYDEWESWSPARRQRFGKGSRANQIAKTLHPFLVEMVQGNLPLYVVDAPMPGSGKTLLDFLCAVVASGRGASPQQYTSDDDEMRKVIHSLAMEGAQRVTFGNIKTGTKVDSGALASAQTSGDGAVSGRVLGASRTGSGTWRGVVSIDGNNVTLSHELARRVLPIRLDANVKDPTAGRKFRQTMPLNEWARKHRGELIWACLTLVQAWIAAGKPMATENILASFESYCRTMGGILNIAGIKGFNANRSCVTVDEQVDEFDCFAKEMLAVFGTGEVRVGICRQYDERDYVRFNNYTEKNLTELLLDLSDNISLGLFDNPNKASLGRRLGNVLAKHNGRVFEIDSSNYRLTKRVLDGAPLWRLCPVKGNEIDRGEPHKRVRRDEKPAPPVLVVPLDPEMLASRP